MIGIVKRLILSAAKLQKCWHFCWMKAKYKKKQFLIFDCKFTQSVKMHKILMISPLLPNSSPIPQPHFGVHPLAHKGSNATLPFSKNHIFFLKTFRFSHPDRSARSRFSCFDEHPVHVFASLLFSPFINLCNKWTLRRRHDGRSFYPYKTTYWKCMLSAANEIGEWLATKCHPISES